MKIKMLPLALLLFALPVLAQERARFGWISWREPATTAVIGARSCTAATEGYAAISATDGSLQVCHSLSWGTALPATGLSALANDCTGPLKVIQFDGAGAASCVTINQVVGTNGATATEVVNSESITLSTVGATTDSSANLLPANSIVHAVVCRVTTTITTATAWVVGDGTTAARFSAANATMAAGTTSVGLDHMKGGVATDAAGPTQTAAAKLRITTTGTPGAGVIRCEVFATVFVAPTS